MRTGPDFKSAKFDPVGGEAEDWVKQRVLEIWSGPNWRTWNYISNECVIQSKDRINSDPVL